VPPAAQKAALLAIAILAAGCANPDRELRSLTAKRLALAPEVAWAKFQSNLPVHDAAREASILAAASDPESRRFFASQIAASRKIQARLIESWKTGAPRPIKPARPLSAELRPAIDAIDNLQRTALSRGAHPPSPEEIETLAERVRPEN